VVLEKHNAQAIAVATKKVASTYQEKDLGSEFQNDVQQVENNLKKVAYLEMQPHKLIKKEKGATP